MSQRILLIAFYNQRALGVQVLARALEQAGHRPHILFFKAYNSTKPSPVTEAELGLLQGLVEELSPDLIGLSVMSSFYLETVNAVHDRLRRAYCGPIVWGGVYATLFPERCLQRADYVIRGEGEGAITELAGALERGRPVSGILNLAYENRMGAVVKNALRPLEENLDSLGGPSMNREQVYYINNDKLARPPAKSRALTYETTASRGCPFVCSYCSSANLKRLYKGKGPFVRFRSVDSVIGELVQARKTHPRLALIHFWDEIFSDEPGWVEEFSARYKREVGVPFTAWGHPLKISEHVTKHLVDAGLHHMVVGVQSGSDRVRRQVFHRGETNEQIVEASKILSRCKVPKVTYDFMLCHPFESLRDLKDSFELCLRLAPPFSLNLHGLNFLPGTDIVDMAVDQGILSPREMEEALWGGMQGQYDRYWGAGERSGERTLWTSLIFLTQFKTARLPARRLAGALEAGGSPVSRALILGPGYVYRRLTALQDIAGKARLVLARR